MSWGFGFGVATTAALLAAGPWLIDLMTASPDVRLVARDYLVYAALASVIGVFAFAYDGIYIGATWTRDMRNLMVVSLLTYLAVWWLTRPLGNTGLWIAILVFFGSRGALAGDALSGAGARDVQAGHGSAVTAAASRPTASASESSRPTRRKSSRSVLIAPIRPTPRKISPL